MNRFCLTLSLTLGLVFASSAFAQAEMSPEWLSLRDSSIQVDEMGLITDQFYLPGIVRVLVRVVNADGQTVFDHWSDQGAVEVYVMDWPDGLYRWDVLSVVEIAADDSSGSANAGRSLARASGIFEVLKGAVLVDDSVDTDVSEARFEGADSAARSPLVRFAGHLLNWLVPSAHASQQVTDYVRISGDYTQVIFKDTTDDDTPFTSDWRIWADDLVFKIEDDSGQGDVIRFPAGVSRNTLIVDSTGDMTLQDGMYFFDRQQPRIGLNRTPNTLGGNLQIEDLTPRISLWDPDTPDGPQQMLLNFDDGVFGIWSTDMQSMFDVVNLNMNAPGNSLELSADGNLGLAETAYIDRAAGALGVGRLPQTLGGQVQVESDAPWLSLHKIGEGLGQMNFDGEYINFGKALQGRYGVSFLNRVRFSMDASGSALVLDANGNLGVGGVSDGAALQVRRNDGSAQIHVKETNAAAAPRTLFRLTNAGNTKFEIEESASGNSWAFTNSGSDFRVSLQDSGTIEFRVDNAGDAFLAGALTQNSDVNAKQAIRPVKPAEVLARIEAIPVSRWQYKDAPGIDHIGPMAQDFHAAFGLGASETGISTIDTGGVALAAIQALAAENRELKDRNDALEARLARLEGQAEKLEVLTRGWTMLPDTRVATSN